jgi:hypothetical protein
VFLVRVVACPCKVSLVDVICDLLVAAVVGLGGYFLGYRRIRYERLYEQRALVIAELSRLFWQVRAHAIQGTDIFSYPAHQDQVQLRNEAANALSDLLNYAYSNAIWLDPKTLQKLETFLQDITDVLTDFQSGLGDQGEHTSQSVEAANSIRRIERG